MVLWYSSMFLWFFFDFGWYIIQLNNIGVHFFIRIMTFGKFQYSFYGASFFVCFSVVDTWHIFVLIISFKSNQQRCYLKRCSEKFRRIHLKAPVAESFFIKVAGLRPATWWKKRHWDQVFSCEFFHIFKNIYFYRTPLNDCFCISVSFRHFLLTHLWLNVPKVFLRFHGGIKWEHWSEMC